MYIDDMYRIAGYIGGNNIWWIARKRKKIAIGGYKFGGFSTITTPSPGVYYTQLAQYWQVNISGVRNPPICQI